MGVCRTALESRAFLTCLPNGAGNVEFSDLARIGLHSNRVSATAVRRPEAMFLASNIIFNDEGLGNWLNCANKLGLRAEADAIKRLSKKLTKRLATTFPKRIWNPIIPATLDRHNNALKVVGDKMQYRVSGKELSAAPGVLSRD